MNQDVQDLASGLVDASYIQQGAQALRRREKLLRTLLANRRIPEEAWDERHIHSLLHTLSGMDSNNFVGNLGAGEREARILSPMVARRHFSFGHGIGRSGDVAAVQPKAAGSSLVNKLANVLILDLLRLCGLKRIKDAAILPVATGMSLMLSMLTIKHQRPAARYVVWPRIDQKSCFKSILAAGLEPLVVEPCRHGDELQTDMDGLRRAVERVGADAVLCVMATTSCFAPRAADDVEGIAVFCRDQDIPHVINHAYGLQASKLCHVVNEACRTGRVDYVVQSLDKNLMVPVGGAVVASPSAAKVAAVAQNYPGRASATPSLDALVTLLNTGRAGLRRLLAQRKEVYAVLKAGMEGVARDFGERVLETPHNPISIGLTLSSVAGAVGEEGATGAAGSTEEGVASGPSPADRAVTMVGSKLFSRNVAVSCTAVKEIGTVTFQGFGAHCNSYPAPYMTAAAAVGMTREDVDDFLGRLRSVLAGARPGTAS